eukprot:TRINITY_DN46675_c0_g1_i1.p1 TRINITY_DN46675_c0_g1~~TRINITY_DN46675_c0_g1_i1.p1  ORF type:complete len:250 (-),score=40.20 TRINITY_DN46675_c0_g1_i1:123-872(-)
MALEEDVSMGKLVPSPPPSSVMSLKLPLSDTCLSLKTVTRLLASTQTREKCLKIIQYSAKLIAYIVVRALEDPSFWSRHFETLSKQLSLARRCFKICRWFKHFEDISDARKEKNVIFRRFLLVDVACNVVADVSEDITSIEKLGVVPKGTLPKRMELYANWCQLVLAGVEMVVSLVKANRLREVSVPNAPLSVKRKHAMANLEVSKYVADLFKAFWDCELSFASELAFCIAGLWAGLVSAHKYALKTLN